LENCPEIAALRECRHFRDQEAGGSNPPAPTKNAVILVLEGRLCADCAHFFALAAQELVSCGLFWIGPKSRLVRNQAVVEKNPSIQTKKGDSLVALGQEPRGPGIKFSRY
jgi:hypothetical protein